MEEIDFFFAFEGAARMRERSARIRVAPQSAELRLGVFGEFTRWLKKLKKQLDFAK